MNLLRSLGQGRPARRSALTVVGSLALALVLAPLAGGCGKTPITKVTFENRYAPSSTNQRVIYRAFWHSASVQDPVAPGSSSAPLDTVPASEQTAYVLLAPGWDPASATPPTSLVVLQSRQDYAVNLNETLEIPVDDGAFDGDCAAGSILTQAQADVITRFVFPNDFAMLGYDAATCTTTQIGDAGAD